MIADGSLAAIQQAWFGVCIPVPADIDAQEPYDILPTGDC